MKLRLQQLTISGIILAVAAMAQPPAPGSEETFNIRIAPPGGSDVQAALAGNTALARKHLDEAHATVQFLSSEMNFIGKAVTNAPYSAEAVTETTQRLADGNRISHKNTANLYRDSEGRTRREDSLGAIGPWANSNEPLLTIFINDPVSGTNLILEPRNRIARKMNAPAFKGPGASGMSIHHAGVGVSSTTSRMEIRSRAVRLNDGSATEDVMFHGLPTMTASTAALDHDAKTESLGKQLMEGVNVEGTRTTVTIPAGAVGNDLPIDIVSERWFSPELQTLVLSKSNDPRMGETVYRLSNIRREEPARNLFEVPSDYALKEEQPMIREFKYEKKDQ